MDRQAIRDYIRASACIETAPTMISRICALLALALLALALPGALRSANAHAILLESAPASGQAVPAGHRVVILRFNSRIDAARSRITLQQGDALEVLKIVPGETADKLVVEVTLQPGAQVLRWQVLAVDGHITRGEIRFTAGANR